MIPAAVRRKIRLAARGFTDAEIDRRLDRDPIDAPDQQFPRRLQPKGWRLCTCGRMAYLRSPWWDPMALPRCSSCNNRERKWRAAEAELKAQAEHRAKTRART